MTERLLSPNGRRLVRTAAVGAQCVEQLIALGWTEYDGPAKATYSKDDRLNGWVVPGTDMNVDTLRYTRTKTLALSRFRQVK